MTGSAYRAGVGIAIVASFLTVWTTIVRDDGTGAGYFMVIMAAAVGGFTAWFRAAGMARTMLGVAVMQLCLGALIATAPVTASTAGWRAKGNAVQRLLHGPVADFGGVLPRFFEGRSRPQGSWVTSFARQWPLSTQRGRSPSGLTGNPTYVVELI